MRNASGVLFGLALIALIGSVAYNVAAYIEIATEVRSGSAFMNPPLSLQQVVYSILTSAGNCALPLFGAAVLWRWDRAGNVRGEVVK
jgi:hypothetical protein